MDVNSKNSNSKKITFYLNPTDSNRSEITAEPTESLQSILNSKSLNEYNQALYSGEKIDITKSISELKIKEGSGVVMHRADDEKNESKEQEKEIETVENRESPKNTQIGTKYHKHGVVLLYSNENWKCQKCHIEKKNNEPKYHCSLPECNFNICKTCIENNSKYPLADYTHKQIYLSKYKFDYHNHPLIYCRSSRHNDNFNFWNCNKCRLLFSNRIWSFYCTYCDFDLCLFCAKKLVPQDDLLNGWGIKLDEHAHTLIYLINNRNWSCNICYASFNSNTAKYYCSICDYNVCNNCKDKRNKEKKNLSLNRNLKNYSEGNFVNTKYHRHSLIYCNTSRNEIETVWNCDVCGIKYGAQSWSFYCTKCDYDVCYNCFKKAKEKNELTFLEKLNDKIKFI